MNSNKIDEEKIDIYVKSIMEAFNKEEIKLLLIKLV